MMPEILKKSHSAVDPLPSSPTPFNDNLPTIHSDPCNSINSNHKFIFCPDTVSANPRNYKSTGNSKQTWSSSSIWSNGQNVTDLERIHSAETYVHPYAPANEDIDVTSDHFNVQQDSQQQMMGLVHPPPPPSTNVYFMESQDFKQTPPYKNYLNTGKFIIAHL